MRNKTEGDIEKKMINDASIVSKIRRLLFGRKTCLNPQTLLDTSDCFPFVSFSCKPFATPNRRRHAAKGRRPWARLFLSCNNTPRTRPTQRRRSLSLINGNCVFGVLVRTTAAGSPPSAQNRGKRIYIQTASNGVRPALSTSPTSGWGVRYGLYDHWAIRSPDLWCAGTRRIRIDSYNLKGAYGQDVYRIRIVV